ncbi:hypothetical protein NQ315_017541 [Exocentrus adspersus]|uniref:Transposase n=1 Tax=Exocentrus adspersus TaxID=1586481 RepID=A0AAV8VJW1_9CUCU|nr:hypothetical protein NQ315_017541 [Exocentrus adspersus]
MMQDAGWNTAIGFSEITCCQTIFFEKNSVFGRVTIYKFGDILGSLQSEIGDILEDLPLNLGQEMYFQQDGAPPHNSKIVIDYLQQRFGQNVISTNGLSGGLQGHLT